MTDKLTLEEQITLFQPLPYGHEYDAMNMPVIKRTLVEDLELDYIKPTNFSNLSAKYNNEDSLVLIFHKDKRFEKLWLHPLKYVPLLGSTRAVLTPNYSIYPSMQYDVVRNNVYRNRYLGCLWQNYRIRVIPTIQWSLPCWDDICFSGVEKNSVVAVSTIGCLEHPQDFLRGYNEMMQRLSPTLVIVYGTLIPGIYGNIFHINYKDAFNKNKLTWKQLNLFQVSPLRKNEYNSLDEFIYEYASGRNLYANPAQYMGIEFRYNRKYYRMCCEPLTEDEMVKLPDGRLGQYDVMWMRTSKRKQYPSCEEFVLIGWYADLEDVLDNCIIDGRKFRDIIMDDATEITGKD